MDTTDTALVISGSRYDRSKVPESSWPDGSPVSNWSKAVAALGFDGNRVRVDDGSIAVREDTELARAA
jgi:hypothetical protein